MSRTRQKTSAQAVVTGGAGFIGGHIAAALAAEGSRVTVVDNFRTGRRENLAGLGVELMEGDIRDGAVLARAFRGADTVFHLAAALSVPESMEKPVEYVEINTNGTIEVIRAAKAAGVRRIVFSSSAAVYGNNPTLPKREEMLPEPLSPYAVTKLDGEYYLKLFATDKLTAVTLRYFNVFGPRQDPSSPYAAAVPIFIRRALRNEEIVVFGDGSQTRDFVFVGDVVRANLHARTMPPGVYNVGNNSVAVIGTLAHDIVKRTGSNSVVRNAPERPGDVKHSRASIDALMATGWKPQYPFGDTLDETVAYYRKENTR